MLRTLLLPIITTAAVSFSTIAFSHCLVPDKAELTFDCRQPEVALTVQVRVFGEEDPRACPSIIDFDLIGEHPVNNISDSFIGGLPIYRRTASNDLEVLVGFGSQNHFSVVLDDENKTGKGYIEFAGGPSWRLNCSYE